MSGALYFCVACDLAFCEAHLSSHPAETHLSGARPTREAAAVYGVEFCAVCSGRFAPKR